MRTTHTLALTAALALAGCAGTPTNQPVTYASVVGLLQTDVPQLEAAAAVYAAAPGADPKVIAGVQAAEAVLNPAVAALSATSSPTSVRAALTDVAVLMAVPGLPISAGTRTDITLALAVVGVLVPAG